MSAEEASRGIAGAAQPPACLLRHRDLIDHGLRAATDRLWPKVGRAVAYHFGWCNAEGLPVDGDSGKGIRPALTLLVTEAYGEPAESALSGAVALELLHNFSLIHDDIIDGDTERRHRPTVWATFGTAQAIIAGDALSNLALNLLLEADRPESQVAAAELCRASAAMIEGQAQDLDFEARLDVTLEEGLAMSARKTGALFACAGALGAIFAHHDHAEELAAWRAFGRDLGTAFQAVDDVLGIWGEPQITGKPRANDVRQRKKSLPILHALRPEAPYRRELTDILTSAEDITETDLARVVALLEASGSRAWALDLAERKLQQALAHLADQPLLPGPAEELRQAAEFLVGRQY